MVDLQYIPNQIHATVFRLLESIYIIENSLAPDTVIGRFQILEYTCEILVEAKSHPRYYVDIQEGIDIYKSNYYDKIPSEAGMQILTQPGGNNLDEYFCVKVFNSFGKQFKKHVEEFRSLKLEKAKAKRKEKMLESMDFVKSKILERSENSNSGEKIFELIKTIETIINTNPNYDDIEF